MYSDQQKQTAFETDLRAVLQYFGFNHIKGSYFEHPFKTEKNSLSFSVFPHSNGKIWIAKDLSTGKTWRILELVKELKNWDFKESIKFLLSFEGQYSEPTNSPFSFSKPNSYKSLPTHKEATEQQINSLNYYLKIERCVSPTLVKDFIEYRQYERNGNRYYALFFKNDSEGYIIRNKAMKNPMCLGILDVTTILYQDSTEWIIFEGFIDFLSAITYYKKPFKGNVLVLNSVVNTDKAIEILKLLAATKIFAFLDNDEAGVIATRQLKNIGIPLIDKVSLFGESKDFNEFLITKKTLTT